RIAPLCQNVAHALASSPTREIMQKLFMVVTCISVDRSYGKLLLSKCSPMRKQFTVIGLACTLFTSPSIRSHSIRFSSLDSREVWRLTLTLGCPLTPVSLCPPAFLPVICTPPACPG